MFHRVMIPLDGSEVAERALPWAHQLTRTGRPLVHLVRVVEPPVRATWVPGPVFTAVRAYDDPVAHAVAEATTYLHGVQARLVAEGVSVEVAHPVGTAGAGPALVAYERAAGIELVLLCSHGRGGVARFALGSVATHLLRHGSAPLLLVRPTSPDQAQRLLVPLDGSRCAEEALPLAADLCERLAMEVTLLRVVSRAEEVPAAQHALEALQSRLCAQSQGTGPVCRARVALGDPAAVIMAQAGTDALVVMATHGRSGLTRWALGSVADRVARQAAAPVLLVRARPSGTTFTQAGRADP